MPYTPNFTTPDPGPQARVRERGAQGDRTFIPGEWGGQGNAIDQNNEYILGTSGAAQDAARYEDMANNPVYTSGPQIDQTQSNETRGMSNDALGLLQGTATGTAPSQAVMLGRQLAGQAENNQYSVANTVRGGAAARAAAARDAQRGAATIGLRQTGMENATRAGEMADARGTLFNAASGQRGQDLGLASSQAGLDAGQRAANDQRNQFYEQSAYNTKQAEMNHRLGRSASDAAAANYAAQNALQQQQNSQQQASQNASMAFGGAQGLASAFGKANQSPDESSKKKNWWDDPDFAGSDERAKTAITPLGSVRPTTATPVDKPTFYDTNDSADPEHTAYLASKLGDVLGGKSKDDAQKSSNGKPPAPPAKKAKPKPTLDEAMREGTEGADPYNPPPAPPLPLQGLIGVPTARGGIAYPIQGYAQTRMHQPGGMFGDEAVGDAPGTEDWNHAMSDEKAKTGILPLYEPPGTELHQSVDGHGYYAMNDAPVLGIAGASLSGPVPHYATKATTDSSSSAPKKKAKKLSPDELSAWADRQIAQTQAATDAIPYTPTAVDPSRDVTISDEKAKRNAYLLGRAHQLEHDNGGKPDFAYGLKPGEDLVDRVINPDQLASGPTMPAPEPVAPPSTDAPIPPPAPPKPPPPPTYGTDPVHPTPRPYRIAGGPHAGHIAHRDRALSDERTKTRSRSESPMASANRSMRPYSYEYKPGFTPPTQHLGEKNVGPMAQNMARDPVARTAIVKDPGSGLLMIDKDKGLKLALGGLADLQMQVDKLKKKGGRR